MEKIIRDGKVAVAVSYGYGAGWSTWCDVNPMDAEFNQLFLDDNYDEALKLAESKDYYAGGLEDVVIEWVDIGDRFEIGEYDGAENLRVLRPDDGYLA